MDSQIVLLCQECGEERFNLLDDKRIICADTDCNTVQEDLVWEYDTTVKFGFNKTLKDMNE